MERWIVKTFEHAGFENNLYLTDNFLKAAKNYQLRLANEDPTPQEVLKLYKEEQDDGRYVEKRKNYLDKIFNTPKRLELFFVYENRLPKHEYYNYNLVGGTMSELDALENACREEYINFKGGK